MSISFNQVAGDAWNVPGSYIEFDNSLANTAALGLKTLLIAPRLNSGLQAANEIQRITSPDQGKENLGAGSLGSLMVASALNASKIIDLHVLAVNDSPAGTAANGNLIVNGSANGAGVFKVWLGEQSTQVKIAASQSQNAIASSIVIAINAKVDWPITAQVNGGNANQVDVTFKHKGQIGNSAEVVLQWEGDYPTSPTFSNNGVVALAGGAGNPDLAPVIANVGDDWFQIIINAYEDDASMDVLDSELENRFDAMTQLGGLNITALRGTLGEATTYAAARNSFTSTILGCNESQSLPAVAAASVGAIASESLERDPARPLQTLEIPGFIPAPRNKRWDAQERNILLREGISTYTVGDDGRARVESLVTTHTQNASGFTDNSYKYVNVIMTLQRIRWEQRKMIASKFPRHKLAEDADLDKFGAGQAIMTPKRFAAEMFVLYAYFVEQGWAQDLENYKATFYAEINASNNSRLDYTDQITLVGGLRIIAGKMQFKNGS